VVSVINSTGGIAAPPWGSRNPDGTATNTLAQFAFFETFLDFDQLGLGPSCPGFAFASAKARSSTSIDSAIHDLAGPFPLDLNTCGKITIEKDAVPNALTDFAYAVTGTGLAAFSLDDDSGVSGADNTLSNTKVFDNIAPGGKVVRETPIPAGWALTGLTCPTISGTGTSVIIDDAAGLNPDDTDFDAGDDRVQITLGNLGEVYCKFTNTLQRSLIISKVAKDFSTAATGNEPLGGVTFVINPDPSDGVGTMSVTDLFAGEGSGNDQFRSASTGKGLICVDVAPSVAGPFSITENPVPTGYEVSGANPQTSVSATTGTCATRGTSAAADSAFVNKPQSKITITFEALADGASGDATAASITCTGISPTPADPTPGAAVFDDFTEVYTSLDEGTYNCQIVIDP